MIIDVRFQTIKIGLISDIHNGPDQETRVGTRAAELLKGFVDDMNNNFKPDFIIELGDRVNNVDHNTDYSHMKQVKNFLKGLRMPVYHILGNHDIANLDKEENKDIMETNYNYKSFDYGGCHFILLDAQDETIGGIGGSMSEKQLNWLKNELEQTSKKTIIFSHQALDEQDIIDNIHFRDYPTYAFVSNREEVRKIIENSKKVIAIFNGHVHWNNMEIINKVCYFSIHSLVEAWTTNGEVCGDYAKAYLYPDGVIEVNILGKNPVNYTHP